MRRNVSDVLTRVQDTVPYIGVELRNIDQRGMFGDTPLIQIMTWNDVAAATLLLEAGTDIAAKGEDGDTALHAAAIFGNAELVALLLANKAPRSIKNDSGYTPFETAKLFGNNDIADLIGNGTD